MNLSKKSRFFFVFALFLVLFFEGPQIFHLLSSNEAYAAQLKSLQTGTTTVAGATTTVTITSVDITKAFLVFGVSETSLGVWDGQVTGQLTNSTTITFARLGGGTPNPTVKWYVAEFASGVSVQRGTATLTNVAPPVNVTLPTAVDTTKSFPIVSLRSAGGSYSAKHFLKAKITTSTNLELALQGAGDSSGSFAEWQVVQYTDANVTSGATDVSFASGDSSKTATVSISDLSKAWLIYSYNTNDPGSHIGHDLVRGQITNATTLTFDRSDTGQAINLTWYLVQFTDGTTVQRGSAAFSPATATQTDVTISAVNTGSSIAVGGYHMRGGRSPDTTAGGGPGVGWFTFDLTSSTNLRITRGQTTSTADVGWFVVQFPGALQYRSVGTNGNNLNTGGRTVQISGTTAIFSGSMPDNIGVGDALTYNSGGNRLAFIYGRTSSTVFTVKDKNGGTPTAAPVLTAVSVYRAYTSLANWQSQTENPNIVEPVENDVNPSKDLVTANTIMNVACYADGQDSAAVVINGWTTAANNYIRIYTPVSSSEVGASQRHSGIWNTTTAYRLVVSNNRAITVSDNYVRFDGLQVFVNSVSASDQQAIAFYNMTGAAVGTVSNCIIRGVSTSYDYHEGIASWSVGALTLYVYNNVIYDFQLSANSQGVIVDDVESIFYVYNNTIQNCYSGIYINAGAIVAKNNLIKGSGNTNTYVGTFSTGTDYNSTDSTDTPGVGSNNRISQTFSFVNESGDDFHLASGDTGARNWGDGSNLPFSTDIDGQPRPSGSAWDIGADEATFQVYYAVGQSISNDLRTGTPTCQVSGTTITFNTAQTDNRFGVGCKVTYGSSNVCYISGKTSSTVWSCTNATGGTPTSAAAGTTVNSIRHAFASLQAAVGGASPGAAGASYLNTTNLVTGGYVLNTPCYYDTGADTTAVTISAWTTGPNNYIKIYTPNNTSTECNLSQRHNGKWDDSKYRIQAASAPINIGASGSGAGNVWIDGLEIYLSSVSGHGNSGILSYQTNAANHRISNNIVRSVTNNTYNYIGIYMYAAAAGSTARIWNNIVYDFAGTTGWGIAFSDGNSTGGYVGYVYNNTVYNCASGYYRDGGTVIYKNNISYSNTDNYYGTYDATSTNNLSGPGSDAEIPPSGARNGVTVSFVNPTGSPPDFHLASSDAGAMESGADLSADANLPFSNDIDGQSRPFGLSWDIGADEYVSPTAVKLISFTATQYSEGILLRWKTGYEVDNLGFQIYREENGRLVRLTPEPVAGSALMAGSRTALRSGHHYHWWDLSSPSTRPSSLATGSSPFATRHSSLGTPRYWLKDIDLSGKETMHGPVMPVFSKEPIPEKFRPELLSEIGWRLQERYQHYWKARELKEKLAEKPKAKVKVEVEVKETPRGHGLRSTPAYAKSASGGRPFEVRASNLKARRAGPLTSRPEADLLRQQFLAGGPAIKLLVKEEGWYRVTQPELVAAGLNSKVNPKYLQLFVEGQEQPIRVLGEKDGRFDPGDAIEFYGEGLDTPSTDTRVYWLVEGTKPGKRIQEFKGYSGSLSSSSFSYTVEKKERRIYFAALRNGDEGNFFGPLVYPAVQADQLLEVRHLDLGASGDALLEVTLQGVTTVAHRVKVLVNETEVGELVFESQSRGTVSLPISQSLLEEGENVVTLEARGGEMDASVIDSIRLTYWHTYKAEDNGLRCKAQGGDQLSIGGFGSSGIRVFDITDSNEAIEVIGKVGSQKGGYAISFRVPGLGERTLLALTEEIVKSPGGVVANHPSSWNQVKEGYDFVMISQRDFVGSLDPLRKLRESQGLRVALIDIEDLYDEFSFGVKSPGAIKDFLTYAKAKWQKPPRFVLLVGDASYDPRNYLGLGNFDLVPTKLVDTAYFETASDDWFVDFNNDGLPEMAVGRLPVQTAEETGIIVSKIVGYEKSGTKREALLVSDKVERSNDFDFERASEEVRGLLPSFLLVRKIYRSQFSSDAQARQELINGINQGPLLVNFIGHGSIGIWNGVLTSEDVEYLTNVGLPFFVGMSCLNGHFQDIYMDSLSEALMKAPGGGAVAVWMSSGLTEPDKQTVMNKELIRLLFGNESLTLGEATARAKTSVSDQDIRRTLILFGDPTTRLK